MEGGQNRRVRKYYKCSNCKIFEGKLVALSDIVKCPSCHNPYKEISETEYKEKKRNLKERKNQTENERRRHRDNSSLHSSRLNINNDNNNFSNNNNIHHHNSRMNNNNNYNRNQNERRENNHHQHHHGDRRHQGQRDNSTDRVNSNQNNNFGNFFGNIFQPFVNFGNQFFMNGNNPFRVVIQRQNVPNDIFDPVFSTFGSMFNGAFQDNFSSNFSSNFRGNFFNEMLRILENNRAEARRNAHPPTSEENLKKLKKFNMNEKYCKKDKDGNYELPNCCICLSEIAKGEKTILLPCGHMFHYECCMTWLKKNNTCPMCRFEIK